MLNLFLEVSSFSLYLVIFLYAWKQLSREEKLNDKVILALGVAVLFHGYLCYQLIDGGEGQNLSLFNIFSMTTWVAMCLVGWNLYRHKAHSLLLVTLPIAGISILEAALFSSSHLIMVQGKPLNLIHILTGIAAMSILLLSALQSALVLYLDRSLKQNPASLNNWLGPLQGMERYLIQLLTIGFVLMSMSLIFVALLPDDIKSTQALHKVYLTIASWLILAALMFGRYVKGWRGVFAARWSLVGISLLLLGYFGSKLVVEFLIK